MQKRVQRQAKRNPVPRCRDTYRDRIGHWSGNMCRQKIKRVAMPGRPRDLDKGPPLRGGFQMPLPRGHECRRQFGNIVQGLSVHCSSSAISMAQQRAIAKAGAIEQHRGQPVLQRRRVGNVTGLDGPLDSAGIGKGADRERWRQPCHQPEQRG